MSNGHWRLIKVYGTSLGRLNVKKWRQSDEYKTSCTHMVIATTGIFTFFGKENFHSFIKFQFCLFLFVCYLFVLLSKDTKLLFPVYNLLTENFGVWSGSIVLSKVYRNTWLGSTIIIFVIQQLCWKEGHVKEIVHNNAMLIKFSKQIANSFAKWSMATKANSKPCQQSEMELFSAKSLLAS